MAILTGFLVSSRKDKKPFWKKIGLVESFRTADGQLIHKVPEFNLRLEENLENTDPRKRYFDVFNVVEVDGKTEKKQIARAYPLKNSSHGFNIPAMNYTALVPKPK